MKKGDINAFKGEIKTALQSWGNGKIDALFPQKASARTFLKKGLDNLLAREDARIDGLVDAASLFIADSDGTIDTDSTVDILKGFFDEMETNEYTIAGCINVRIGKGELVVDIPHNFMFDMILGNVGSIRFTSEDLDDLKTFFKD